MSHRSRPALLTLLSTLLLACAGGSETSGSSLSGFVSQGPSSDPTAAATGMSTTGEPTLVEVITYRFRGHSMSDPGLYRTKEEVEEWRRRDPLNRSRSRLLEIGMAEAAIEALEADVKAEIEDSVKFAEDSAPADAYKPYVMKGAQ